jgi:hypothetical protein
MNNKNILTVLALIAIAFITRFIPHAPNFTAIGAMALFGGAYLKDKKVAFFIPLAALVLSDLILGFHNTMIAVYASFLAIGLIGFTLSGKVNVKNVAFASIASSALFFVVTNFAVWAVSDFYSKDMLGLTACYVSAIPFFTNTILADLFYSSLLFGAMHLITQTNLIKQRI